MAVSLLQVGDHLSLEFDVSDLDAVRAYIREIHPDVTSRWAGAIAMVVQFAAEEFTFQNEWDDPCLISGTARGDELLRAIHAHFSRTA
jgi:hypothetical protein